MSTETEQHLDLLAVFHFVVGGFGVFFACLPLIHIAVGALMLSGALDAGEDARFAGYLFLVVGGIFFMIGQTMSWMVIYSGRQLKQRRRYMFSFVIGCVLCLAFPFGTVLGVFTLMVLSKPEAKALYSEPVSF